MDMLQGEVRARLYHEGETVFCESVGEYTLPDYMPEMRKLLRIETHLLPTGRFIGGGKAEFSGVTVHTVYYSDGEGRLCATVQSGDYRCAVPLASEDAEVFADCRVERVSHRLGGPRRLGIRTSIAAHVTVLQSESVPSIDCGDACGLECLYARDTVCDRKYIVLDEITLTDAVHVDGYTAGEVRPIATDASVFVREARPQGESISITGEVWVRLLYACGTQGEGEVQNEMPDVLLRKIPFDAFLSEGGLSAVTVHGVCTSIDASVDDDGLGGCDVNLSLRILLEGEGVQNRELVYCKDAYAHDAPTETAVRHMPLARFLGTLTQNVSISGSAPLDGALSSARALDCSAVPSRAEITCEDGKLRITLDCAVSGIVALTDTDDGGLQYEKVEFSCPVKAELDARQMATDGAHYTVAPTFLGGTMRIDGDNIRMDGELVLTVTAFLPCTLTVLDRVERMPEGAAEEEQCDLRVVYPQDCDTLWTVAKRYRAHLARLAKQNGIPEQKAMEPDLPEAIDGINALIIS